MTQNPILEIDGRRLYYTFVAGAKKILDNQAELNKMNVFPVNDGDTGTNLASTIRAVIDTLTAHRSYKITADAIAQKTIEHARGNSGIIFAQFFYGLSRETGNAGTISLDNFAMSVKNSVKYIYDAVANPVEGTMLTVIKEWAEFIYTNKTIINDFNQLFIRSKEVLVKSLNETKQKLEVLKKANVVDAGAKGFVLFIEGIIEFIQARNIRKLIQSKPKAVMALEVDNHIDEHVNFRYCTEAMLENTSFDTKTLSEMLLKHGDSVVVAGSEKMRRIHLHTNHPADLFYQLKDYGTISFQKADDMIRQSEVVYKRKWKIGLVTDSTCDLSPELIDKYQIQMLPINISIGDNHYLDKITIQPDQFYSQLSLSGSFPKTSQINEKAFVNVYSHLASHYDSVIAIHLTDKFSGTFFNSYKAGQSIANEFNKPISVINSKNLSGALGLIVLRTAQAIEAGLPHAEIVKMTEKWIENSRIFVSVRTLKYMVRGGRVSYFKGLIASLLNVNPIVSMDKDGKSQVFDKAYSQKANMAKVMKHVKNITKNRRIWNYVVLHAHNLDAADWFTQEMKNFTGKEPVSVVNISPVIGLNAGIGTASVAFMFD